MTVGDPLAGYAHLFERGDHQFCPAVWRCGVHCHAGFYEHWMQVAHDGGGFDVFLVHLGHGLADQFDRQAYGPELRVDYHA